MKFEEFDVAHENLRRREYNSLVDRAEKAERERDEARTERDRARLKVGQMQAWKAVMAQLCAQLARNGRQHEAKAWLKKADEAFSNVQLEDLVRVHLNRESGGEGES